MDEFIRQAGKKIRDKTRKAAGKTADSAAKTEEAFEETAEKAAGIVMDAADVTARRSAGLIARTREFFRLEAAGGIILVIAAMAALIVANSPLHGFYYHILNGINFSIGFSGVETDFDLEIQKSLLLWINDGLMAVFFFLVGLEIKRELVEGGLSTRDKALLPALAAIGGMAVPAAIYWYINKDMPENLDGWAIPAATDIAFALGVLALVGSRAPVSLKILLTAIAIIDDIGAIVIIALFYTADIEFIPLEFAAAALALLFVLNRKNVSNVAPYILTGIIMWVAVLESGIHATLAGVITALFIPVRSKKNPEHSPCGYLEHSLHPWVAFGVLPVFAFANAGVPFYGMTLADLLDPVTLGIALGLFVGKQIGIFGIMWLTIVSGLSPKPKDANWTQLYAVSLLCGIGFTMSLFIGGLAFEGVEMQASVRMGVLMGSVCSAVLAYLLLRYGPACRKYKACHPAQ